ncbi:MAG: hypothetical protein ACR2IF_15505 [Terriglobales bacterium]
MKIRLLGFALLASCAALAQVTPPSTATVFSGIDDNTTNWGNCTGTCAGGATAYSTSYMAQFQTTPSKDGDSTKFYVDGPAWTDMLFWNKVGPHDSFSNFQFDFWFMLDSNSTTIGQAIEFDAFQFAKGVEYMFGTQCDYGAGVWDIWNQKSGHWIQTGIACPKFTPNVWYHATWNFHRSARKQQPMMYYDSLTLVQYDANDNAVYNVTYTLNTGEPAGPEPSGWSDNMGVQFQLDLNGNSGASGYPSAVTEWIDQVKLTAW